MKDFLGYVDEYMATKRGYNFLRLLSPLGCMMCGEIDSVSNGPFCTECYDEFEKLFYIPCPICGAEKENCECCKMPGIKKIFFLFWYDKNLSSDIISKIKYMGEKRQISYLGKLIANEIKKQANNLTFDCVCYVPRGKRNIKKLGFDQSKLLAESVAFYLDAQVSHCLYRRGRSAEQKKLSGEERSKNVKNKFAVNTERFICKQEKVPKNVILIDDVVTTGSTIKECSYLLRKSGIKNVYVGAVGKTPYKKRRYVKKRR